MFPILSFATAVVGFALAAAVLLLGWRQWRRTRQRLDDLTQTLHALSVSQERIERTWNDFQQRQPETASGILEIKASLEDLEGRFTEVESYAAVCVPPKPVASGLNINRRVEAVRMLQEGLSEEQVSAELGIALSEVRLIGHLEKNAPRPAAKRSRRVA
ncbi:MAG: hypothetical protein U5J83_10990 [Bryobacterales bacterium]|nr:hypothetical protein [Bryobacterales bacterium]